MIASGPPRETLILSRLMLALTLATAARAVAADDTDAAPRPNVILLMADDLGWGDVGFNGNTVIATPHLDALAREGTTLTRFYAASPVCSPTRASCLTGRHGRRMGIVGANAGHLPPGETTLAESLRALGYATGHFGKWHLGTLTRTERDSNRGGPRGAAHYAPPWEHGFDACFSTEAKVPTWDPMRRPVANAPTTFWLPLGPGAAAADYGTRYWTGADRAAIDNLSGDDSRVIMDRALAFVGGAAARGQPFLAVVWFHAPHRPLVAGPGQHARYAAHPAHERSYYGSVTGMDEQVGRLRARLEALGAADHTMVWFCSDNGPEGKAGAAPGSAGPFRGRKRDLYEGGVRVPACVTWPGHIRAGATSDFPIVTSDCLPTILSMLGAAPSDDRVLDGIDVTPALAGTITTRPRPIGFSSGKRSSWVVDRFKLITLDEGATFALYDLLADPGETQDVSGVHAERAAAMRRELDAWLASSVSR